MSIGGVLVQLFFGLSCSESLHVDELHCIKELMFPVTVVMGHRKQIPDGSRKNAMGQGRQ